MTNGGRIVTWAADREADIQQAQVFHSLLAERRAELCDRLDEQAIKLTRYEQSHDSDGARRKHRRIKQIEPWAEIGGEGQGIIGRWCWCWRTPVFAGVRRSRCGCATSSSLRRRLSVAENAVQIGVRHAVGPTKGLKARSVPVPGFVLDELSVQCRGKAPGDLVFPGPGGGYLPRPKSTNGWFIRAVKLAGVQSVTPHDLRHSCASISVSAGVNVLALQRMLGHTSAKVTLDTYADLFDDDLDAVASALDLKCAHSAPKPRPVISIQS